MTDWIDVIDFFKSEKFNKIAQFLRDQRNQGKTIFPSSENILKALSLTPLESTKVVIIGQDPYPTPGHANGLAFSVNRGVTPLPKSLQNIFKELESDIGVKRTNGDLTDWAVQGVLLLNTSLTVEQGQPASHNNIGWSALVHDVIDAINEHKTNVVFILWGNHAKKFLPRIDQTKHHVITSAHPSPLSASRGFFGSKPFSQTNQYLLENGLDPIKWAADE